MELVSQMKEMLETNALPGRDASFAKSLCDFFDTKGYLTDRQAYYAEKMVQRVINPPPVAQMGADLSKVHSFLMAAREHLKYPKLILQTANGTQFKVSLSGSRSRYPDTVNINISDGYGFNEWIGRVLSDGTWHKPRAIDEEFVENQLMPVLEQLAEQPAETAASFGHLTGNCCFCHHKLDDERSTSVGYGPVCAKNYKLPWGKRKN